MHSDTYELIWLKLDLIIDTTELYILILVFWTLTLIQGHGDARKQKVLSNYFLKLSVDVIGIWHAVETCWFDEFHTNFMWPNQYQGRESNLGGFLPKTAMLACM